MGIFFNLVLTAIFVVLSIILRPKPQKAKPQEVTDFEVPTADLDRPVPVVTGCVYTTGNVVAATDIGHQRLKVKA